MAKQNKQTPKQPQKVKQVSIPEMKEHTQNFVYILYMYKTIHTKTCQHINNACGICMLLRALKL